MSDIENKDKALYTPLIPQRNTKYYNKRGFTYEFGYDKGNDMDIMYGGLTGPEKRSSLERGVPDLPKLNEDFPSISTIPLNVGPGSNLLFCYVDKENHKEFFDLSEDLIDDKYTVYFFPKNDGNTSAVDRVVGQTLVETIKDVVKRRDTGDKATPNDVGLIEHNDQIAVFVSSHLMTTAETFKAFQKRLDALYIERDLIGRRYFVYTSDLPEDVKTLSDHVKNLNENIDGNLERLFENHTFFAHFYNGVFSDDIYASFERLPGSVPFTNTVRITLDQDNVDLTRAIEHVKALDNFNQSDVSASVFETTIHKDDKSGDIYDRFYELHRALGDSALYLPRNLEKLALEYESEMDLGFKTKIDANKITLSLDLDEKDTAYLSSRVKDIFSKAIRKAFDLNKDPFLKLYIKGDTQQIDITYPTTPEFLHDKDPQELASAINHEIYHDYLSLDDGMVSIDQPRLDALSEKITNELGMMATAYHGHIILTLPQEGLDISEHMDCYNTLSELISDIGGHIDTERVSIDGEMKLKLSSAKPNDLSVLDTFSGVYDELLVATKQKFIETCHTKFVACDMDDHGLIQSLHIQDNMKEHIERIKCVDILSRTFMNSIQYERVDDDIIYSGKLHKLFHFNGRYNGFENRLYEAFENQGIDRDVLEMFFYTSINSDSTTLVAVNAGIANIDMDQLHLLAECSDKVFSQLEHEFYVYTDKRLDDVAKGLKPLKSYFDLDMRLTNRPDGNSFYKGKVTQFGEHNDTMARIINTTLNINMDDQFNGLGWYENIKTKTLLNASSFENQVIVPMRMMYEYGIDGVIETTVSDICQELESKGISWTPENQGQSKAERFKLRHEKRFKLNKSDVITETLQNMAQQLSEHQKTVENDGFDFGI